MLLSTCAVPRDGNGRVQPDVLNASNVASRRMSLVLYLLLLVLAMYYPLSSSTSVTRHYQIFHITHRAQRRKKSLITLSHASRCRRTSAWGHGRPLSPGY